MTSIGHDNDAGLAGFLAKLDWAITTEPLTFGYAVIGLTNFGARPVEITRLAEVLHMPVNEAEVRVRKWGGATFLVLARKAGSITRPALLGNWLYGVACRISLKARAATARRRSRETTVGAPFAMASAPAVAPDDLGRLIDEEVRRLPEKIRLPFVLCHLEGRTNEEAARILGCPKGTIFSRLATARERLRSRLTRRGVAPCAAPWAVLSAVDAPAAFVHSTVRDVLLLAGGKTAASGAVSAKAIALAEGAMRTMFFNKVQTALGAAVLAAILAGSLVCYALAEKPAAAKPEAKPDVKPEPAPAALTFKTVPVNADDIMDVTGLSIYKFRLDISKGEKFRVAWTEFPAEGGDGKELHSFDFQKKDEDGPITFRVSFMRTDGKFRGALFSQEEMDFRCVCEGCSPSFIGTILPALSFLPPTERTLYVVQSEKNEGSTVHPGLIRLISIFRSMPLKSLNDIASIYPRVELTLERDPTPR